MICPNCEHRNPESNKFCGMCGSKLEVVESPDRPAQEATPVENSGGTHRPFIVSTTAMADVTAQMLNSRVVLPAPTLTSSHSGYASPLKPTEQPFRDHILNPSDRPAVPAEAEEAVEEEQETPVHDAELDSHEDIDTERWLEQTAAEHESRMPPATSSTTSSGSVLGLSTPSGSSAFTYDEPGESEPEPARDRNSFLYIEEPVEHQPSRDVSGPSFLGLGADDEVAYEEEPHSGRGRRYLLLATLAIVAVLGALEWRASQNGDSTNPMDVLHLKLPKKKGGEVQVMQPSSSSNASVPTAASDGSGPSPTNSASDSAANSSPSGKPDLIADQSQPSAAKPTPDNGSPNSSSQQPQNTPQPQASAPQQATPPASSKQTASSPAATATKPTDTTSKSPTRSTELADANLPAATSRKPAAAEPARTTKAVPSKPAPVAAEAAPEPDANLSAGGAELQKGIAAGSSEMGRMWLWRATAKGNGEAPVLLADMYAQGKGVPRDCEQAMLLLNAAAKKMNVRARSKLGSMYAAGECVPQDKVKAYKWMSAALEANPGSEWLEKNRESLLRDMTPAERQRASR